MFASAGPAFESEPPLDDEEDEPPDDEEEDELLPGSSPGYGNCCPALGADPPAGPGALGVVVPPPAGAGASGFTEVPGPSPGYGNCCPALAGAGQGFCSVEVVGPGHFAGAGASGTGAGVACPNPGTVAHNAPIPTISRAALRPVCPNFIPAILRLHAPLRRPSGILSPMCQALIIRSSAIHAAGCYTMRPIRSGERILEYGGPRFPKEVADERYKNRIVTYLFSFGESGEVIDGFGTAMFLNHSCDPNCETEEDEGRIYIRSIRDIPAGEELVYEYNLHDSDDEPGDCHCGAPQCRGTMFSATEVKRRAKRSRTPKPAANPAPKRTAKPR